jgi:hypothetical protein
VLAQQVHPARRAGHEGWLGMISGAKAFDRAGGSWGTINGH